MLFATRVSCKPKSLIANSDIGYVVTASLKGQTLKLEAEAVVVSDSRFAGPAYDGYIVAPRVYGNDRVPTLAEQVAESLGWEPGLTLNHCLEKDAKEFLKQNIEKTLEMF